MLALLIVLLVYLRPLSSVTVLLSAGLAILIVLSLSWVYRYTNEHFIEPDLAFRLWLQQVCDGELDARIGLSESHRHHKELNFHTRNLAKSLRSLSDDMDNLVESQTHRLQEQKSVVELLFKLTSDVSSEAENKAAFVTVCEHLSDWFGSACVCCCRVIEGEHLLACVAVSQHGKSTTNDFNDNDVPSFTVDQIPDDIKTTQSDSAVASWRMWVPFFVGPDAAGMLVIEHDSPSLSEHRDTRRVLATVSEQLGLLCEKQLVQSQILQTRLNKDRNELAGEIHDSLAQTLLAMRYQTTLLSEKLKSRGDRDTYNDVVKIGGSIEEANEEIRGLIREYRNPLAEHRTADALQTAIDQFSQASGVEVFFQSDDPHLRFTPREESVVQRIVVEALNNTSKYANASMVRVFLRCDETGVRRILIEDDGIGFDQSKRPHNALEGGEHIGLTLMQERALSIGANLTIESELGDGTRISIALPPLIESRRATV